MLDNRNSAVPRSDLSERDGPRELAKVIPLYEAGSLEWLTLAHQKHFDCFPTGVKITNKVRNKLVGDLAGVVDLLKHYDPDSVPNLSFVPKNVFHDYTELSFYFDGLRKHLGGEQPDFGYTEKQK
jgi:hypothetical protein